MLLFLQNGGKWSNLVLRMYYSKCNVGYVVRAEIGEEIQSALCQFSAAVDLRAAYYQGIGMLTRVELAFFCTGAKSWETRMFDGEYELISLMGNLSEEDGIVSPHTHVTLADRNFQTFSGHLVRGVVSLTAEIFITALDLSLKRKEDSLLKYKELISSRRARLKVDV